MDEMSVSITKNGKSAESVRFSSLCESCTLCVRAQTDANQALTYTLVGLNQKGESFVVYQKDFAADGAGEATILHEFDPVSLAVYQDAVAFFVRIDGACGELTVTLTENEQIAMQLQAVKARRCRPKQNKGEIGHVLFVGNSILVGMEMQYGMCASSPEHDYAYHVTSEIRKCYPNCRFSKLYASPIEHAECEDDFETVFFKTPNELTHAPACESFTPDLDLIILQMTDNVNTEKKVETFRKTADRLLAYIKEKCPKATVVWAYGWFHKSAIFSRLLELCEAYDIEQADLRGCRCKANEAISGHRYLSADGTLKTARDTWITHPGDGGMRAIADCILTTLREASVLPESE